MVSEQDVALVGMSCVFPLAVNLEQYWSNLVNGVDAIGRPPAGRWAGYSNFRRPPDDEAFLASDWGGYLDLGLTFDPVAYGIPPNQVRHSDPDQFFALHLIDQALRDARIADDSPLRARTDVLLGYGSFPTCKQGEWSLRTEHFEAVLELLERYSPGLLDGRRQELEDYLRGALTPPELDSVSTAIHTLVACRAANRLNLRGTACVIDAACASSLVAVEQAMWRLRNGRCDLAVAGGVFVSLKTYILYLFTRLGALSPSGVVRPFDRRADGMLPGEGGGVVVLKRLADAILDGDHVYAILRGAASASDGREVDVLAPSSAGQIAALEAAYADARVDRDTVGYLELHGTGTVAGDAVEIATVKGFFGTVKEPATARAMGSVKSMIGHTLAAAGIAGLIKAALSLSNKVLCPSLHCEEPRPELADAPFYINTRTRPWVHDPGPGPAPRRRQRLWLRRNQRPRHPGRGAPRDTSPKHKRGFRSSLACASGLCLATARRAEPALAKRAGRFLGRFGGRANCEARPPGALPRPGRHRPDPGGRHLVADGRTGPRPVGQAGAGLRGRRTPAPAPPHLARAS